MRVYPYTKKRGLFSSGSSSLSQKRLLLLLHSMVSFILFAADYTELEKKPKSQMLDSTENDSVEVVVVVVVGVVAVAVVVIVVGRTSGSSTGGSGKRQRKLEMCLTRLNEKDNNNQRLQMKLKNEAHPDRTETEK